MNGPSCMYTIQPTSFTSCEKIKYPKCMYPMKTIQTSLSEVDRVESVANSRLSCVPLAVEKPVSILDQVNNFLKKPLPGMENLEIRQEAILEQLTQLKFQVATLRANLSCPSAPNLTKTPKVTSSSVVNSVQKSFKDKFLQHDMVINASPQYPPYSLLAVRKLWKNSVRLRVSWHTHSNIVQVSEEATTFMKANWEMSADTNLPLFKVSVVWKNVGPDTEMVVTPMSRITIRGEVNILRFLSRHGPSLFAAKAQTNPAFTTEIDDILDTSHSLAWARTAKDKQAIVRLLNGKLRKSQFFMGNELSIADIAAWSVIKQVNACKDLTVNMSKWSDRCSYLCSEE